VRSANTKPVNKNVKKQSSPQKPRTEKEEDTTPTDDEGDYDQDDEFADCGEPGDIKFEIYEGGDGDYDHDGFFDEEDIGPEVRSPLCSVSRFVRLFKELPGARDKHGNEVSTTIMEEFFDGSIDCWLNNYQTVVLSVSGMTDKGAVVQAEAEITGSDLQTLIELPVDEEGRLEPEGLMDLAQQLVDNVEVKAESSDVFRLILNLMADGDDGDASSQGSNLYNNDWEGTALTPAICASEEELNDMLLPGLYVYSLLVLFSYF
jgi:hypothetical protein